MSKEHVIEKLSLYIDNVISDKERNKIEEHLKECQECRSELELLKKTSSIVSQWQVPSPNPDFEQKVKTRIFNWEMEKEANKMEPRLKWYQLRMPAPAIAGIIIFLIAGTLMQAYVKRGIQGRMRDASDQIGDQFSAKFTKYKVATQKYEPYYISQSDSKKPVEKSITRGADYIRDKAWFYNQEAQKTGNTGVGQSEYQAATGTVTYGKYEEPGVSPVIVIQPALPAVGEGEKVIRTADIRLEVENSQDTYTKISELCKELNGFLAQSQFYKDNDSVQSGTITIRIPKDKFETALERIRKLGKVEKINTQSQDVSSQYADLKSRLKTAMIVYEKMLKALEERKVTIPEAMKLESELTPITNRIEEIKVEIEKLDNLTSFTTIKVQFNEAKVSSAVIKENIKKAKDNIVLSLLGGLHFIVKKGPSLLLLFMLWVIGIPTVVFLIHKINSYLNKK